MTTRCEGHSTAPPHVLLHSRYAVGTAPLAIAEAGALVNELDEHLSTRRRLLHIAIESIQNVMRHSTPMGGTAEDFTLTITSENGQFKVTTVNAILKEQIARLSDTIQGINMAEAKGLKILYVHSLKGGIGGSAGGTGLGLIDMARRSGKKLLCEFQEISKEYCFFRFEVTVSR